VPVQSMEASIDACIHRAISRDVVGVVGQLIRTYN
jgi:hypothetical protein